MSVLTDRTFGIEIECGGDRETLINAIRDKCGFTPHVHGDGSGNEIHTRVLSGREGFRELHKQMNAIRRAGGWVSQSDGMHVHHGAAEFVGNPELQSRLVANFLNMESAIESIIAPYRRGNYGACRRQFIKNVHRVSKDFYIPNGRGKLNLSNLLPRSYQAHTIEYRMHEGCLDPNVAEAWVRLGQALIERTLESPKVFRGCSTVRGLGSQLGLNRSTIEVLKEKAATVKNPPTSSYMRANDPILRAQREEWAAAEAREQERRRRERQAYWTRYYGRTTTSIRTY